jgi:hypothetical protein
MAKYLVIGTMVFITILLYGCCIAAGEADRREERWFEKRNWK